MTDTTLVQRSHRAARPDAASHLFAVGQSVRLKRGFAMSLKATDTYHITATLPPRENSPQYRIRNDDERHERVTTQDTLEPVGHPLPGNGETLIERTFGNG